MVARVLSTT